MPKECNLVEINFDDSVIIDSNNEKLHFSHWGFENNPEHIIVALHGMNDYANSFNLMGPFLAQQNIATFAYDARHFGRNANRGDWAGAINMAKDFIAIIDALKIKFPDKQIVALGDSMGGSTILSSYFNKLRHNADKVILVAPGVSGWTNQPVIYRMGLWLMNKFIPKKQLTPPKIAYKVIKASDNDEMLNQVGRDENMIWQTIPSTLKGLVDMMEQAFRAAPFLGDVPTMIMFAGKDQIIPPASSKKFAKKLKKKIEVKNYPEAYHMLLRDNSREIYFDQIVQFIQCK